MKVNDAIRKYYRAFCVFRADVELPDDEEIAFRNIEEACLRIENDARANLDDLNMQDSIRTAHLAMGWRAEEVPTLSFERPLYRLGKYQPLNNTLIAYYFRIRKLRERTSTAGRLFQRPSDLIYSRLREAYQRIEKDRNAPVDDLQLLEAIHEAHKLLELDPVDVPHLDVSRYYEGPTVHDAIDDLNDHREANQRKLLRPRRVAVPR